MNHSPVARADAGAYEWHKVTLAHAIDSPHRQEGLPLAHIGLLARGGDQLGHLVRGVQMMHSFGREFEIQGSSGIYAGEDAGGPYLAAVVPVRTTATPQELWGMCREVEWSLGGSQLEDAPEALAVQILTHAGEQQPRGEHPAPHPWIRARSDIRAALQELGMALPAEQAQPAAGAAVLHMAAADFAALFQLGQRDGHRGEEIIGRQPSAGGWGS